MRRKALCPAQFTMHFVDGRWKLTILWSLFHGVKRFSELRAALKGVTHKMLTQHLREMERDGLVTRTVYAQIPPRVEYELTPAGQSLRPVVDAMSAWAFANGYVKPEKREPVSSASSAEARCAPETA
jgi:DNA-binding HxlR family transcriptional regulator